MVPFRFAFAALALSTTALPAGAAFELSEDYVANPELRSGYYICRTVHDLYSATYSFDLVTESASRGKYKVRTLLSKGMAEVAQNGSLTFVSGFFAPDEFATYWGMNTIRIEDGTPAIILRADYGDGYLEHYCPWIE